MPIYEYACHACGHELEAWQKLSEKPLKKCPACGRMQLKKQISAVGFRLKGGGWYETDFKSSGKRNVAGDSDDGEKKNASDSGDKKKDKNASGKKSSDKHSSKGTGAAA
jgi:putative FmdB family regulatory protein